MSVATVTGGDVRNVGNEQLLVATSKALASIPTGADAPTYAVIQAETKDVRWHGDGTAPTTSVGNILTAGSSMTYNAQLSGLRFIETANTAKVNVQYFQT